MIIALRYEIWIFTTDKTNACYNFHISLLAFSPLFLCVRSIQSYRFDVIHIYFINMYISYSLSSHLACFDMEKSFTIITRIMEYHSCVLPYRSNNLWVKTEKLKWTNKLNDTYWCIVLRVLEDWDICGPDFAVDVYALFM